MGKPWPKLTPRQTTPPAGSRNVRTETRFNVIEGATQLP